MHIAVDKSRIFVILIILGTFLSVGFLKFYRVYIKGDTLSENNLIVLLIVLIGALLVSFFLIIFFFSKMGYAAVKVKIHENKLAGSYSKFRWLYKNSPIPYITIDKHSEITLFNLAALRLFAMRDDELISKNISSLFYVENETVLSIVLGKLKKGVTLNEEEVQIIRIDGSRRWVLLSAFTCSNSAERLLSFVDITKQKQIDAAKTDFVSFASHQLRTPIAAMRWNLELLGAEQTGVLSEGQLGYHTKLTRSVQKMVTLIDDFLNVSKLELGTFATEKTDIPLTHFFEDILGEFQERIEKKKLTIKRQFGEADFVFRTDKRLLHIIVSNLVSNAVKYTKEGGAIALGFSADDAVLKISVEDTGFGIPSNEKENLFSKFFRATNAQKEVSEGTGLGLYIVDQSVSSLGGSIAVDSEEGKGSLFVVTLPLQ